MGLTPWHASRSFGVGAFATGLLCVLHSLLNWNFLELNRPAGLPQPVQRVLISVMGVILLVFGVVFFILNF